MVMRMNENKNNQKLIDEFIDVRPLIIDGKKKYIVCWRGHIPEIVIEDGVFYYYTTDGRKVRGTIKKISKRFITVVFETEEVKHTMVIYKTKAIVHHIKEKS